MESFKKQIVAMVLIGVIVLGGLLLASLLKGTKVTGFDQCVRAGNPVMESFPRQCMADGKVYVEQQ